MPALSSFFVPDLKRKLSTDFALIISCYDTVSFSAFVHHLCFMLSFMENKSLLCRSNRTQALWPGFLKTAIHSEDLAASGILWRSEAICAMLYLMLSDWSTAHMAVFPSNHPSFFSVTLTIRATHTWHRWHSIYMWHAVTGLFYVDSIFSSSSIVNNEGGACWRSHIRSHKHKTFSLVCVMSEVYFVEQRRIGQSVLLQNAISLLL